MLAETIMVATGGQEGIEAAETLRGYVKLDV